MDYISTKELAERWGVSKSRILFLVKEGRLSDAEKIGHSWVFPDNIEKPADMRSYSAAGTTGNDYFRFPLYLYNHYTQADVENNFTPNESALYRAEVSFYRSEYEEAYRACISLLSAPTDIVVRAGALYYCCLCSIQLHKNRPFKTHYESLQSLLSQDIPYRRELSLLLHDLDSYFLGNTYYSLDFCVDESYHYHESARNYLCLVSAYVLLLKHFESGVGIYSAPYEILCQSFEERKCEYSAQVMHGYLAAMCCINGEKETAKTHLRKSLRQAQKLGSLDVEMIFYHFFADFFDTVLAEEEFVALRVLKEKTAGFYKSVQKLLDYLGKSSTFVNFTEKDIEYIQYAMKGLSNKEIADLKGLSVSTVSKYFSMLYEMTGTRGRKELIETCSQAILNYTDSNR